MGTSNLAQRHLYVAVRKRVLYNDSKSTMYALTGSYLI